MSFDETLDTDSAPTAVKNPFSMVALCMRVHGMTLGEVHHATVADHVFSLYGKDKERPMFSIPFQSAAEATKAHSILIGELADLDRELRRHFVFRG